MTAWTSPALTVRSMPLRISFSPALARSPLISSTRESPRCVELNSLTHTSFQTHPEQLLCFHRKLHRKLLEDLFAEPVHDHGDCVLRVQATLLEIKNLVLSDLGGRRFVLD